MEKLKLPNSLSIRLANPSDASYLDALFHENYAFLYLSQLHSEEVHQLINLQQKWQEQGYGTQSPNAYTFVIEKQNQIIGKVIIDFGQNIAHILDIIFSQNVQGLGYGKSVLLAVQDVAKQQGVPVGLSVHIQNHGAKKLYLSLGFTLHEQSPSHEFLMWYPPAKAQIVMP